MNAITDDQVADFFIELLEELKKDAGLLAKEIAPLVSCTPGNLSSIKLKNSEPKAGLAFRLIALHKNLLPKSKLTYPGG